MTYCAERGIPHSIFLGRPWPRPGEPMWLDEDQDKIVAWLRARHEVCQQCGTIESDWIDPVTGRYFDQPKWEAVTYRCPGCAEVQRAARDVPEGEPGVRVLLVPADIDEREEDDDAV